MVLNQLQGNEKMVMATRLVVSVDKKMRMCLILLAAWEKFGFSTIVILIIRLSIYISKLYILETLSTLICPRSDQLHGTKVASFKVQTWQVHLELTLHKRLAIGSWKAL